MELNPYTGKWEIEGSFPDLLKTLAKTMNFTYTVTPPPDNKWGGQQPDGSWNGMMLEVTTGKIDFGKVEKRFKKIAWIQSHHLHLQ